MKFKLKNNHPTNKKLNKIIGLMNELGIRVQFEGSNTIICDVDFPTQTIYLEDIEDSSMPETLFPPEFEYKLVFYKD